MTSMIVGCGLLAWSVGWIGGEAAASGWKAGAAREVITPQQSLWMAGYAARTKPSEGAYHDLWTKALALEDPEGRKAVLISLDVCGIDRDLSNAIRDNLKRKHGLDRERIVLACSHTHSGPVLGSNLITMYPLDDEQKQRVRDYTEELRRKVEAVAAKALETLHPAELAWESGRADFAVNRRANKEGDGPTLRSKGGLAGPIDHDVPVLRVTGEGGKLDAVVSGYACHCTVLSGYQFSGDYAGFAQDVLEKNHPGAVALFVAGCGGDQNPIPRRTVEQARDYGAQLAAAVEHVLKGGMRPVSGPLAAGYREIDLPFADVGDAAFWKTETQSSDKYRVGRAKALLARIEREGSLTKTYPYPVQAWKLGPDLTWIFLGGEVTVDYSLRFKRNLGSSRTWVSAYCNDVMAYIPSLRVLKEGGYEGAGAMVYYGQPSAWAESVEEDIVGAVVSLLNGLNAKP